MRALMMQAPLRIPSLLEHAARDLARPEPTDAGLTADLAECVIELFAHICGWNDERELPLER